MPQMLLLLCNAGRHRNELLHAKRNDFMQGWLLEVSAIVSRQSLNHHSIDAHKSSLVAFFFSRESWRKMERNKKTRAKSIKFQLNDVENFFLLLFLNFWGFLRRSLFFRAPLKPHFTCRQATERPRIVLNYKLFIHKIRDEKKNRWKKSLKRTTTKERFTFSNRARNDYLRTEISITIVINVKCKHFVCGKKINCETLLRDFFPLLPQLCMS